MKASHRLDRVVVQLAEVARLHVGLGTLRPEGIEQALHLHVGHLADQVRDGVAEITDRLQHPHPLLGIAGVAADQSDELLAVPILGQEGGGRRGDQVDQGGQLVRKVARELAVEAHDLLGALAGIEDRAGGHGRADRVQIELEDGYDTEIAASAT